MKGVVLAAGDGSRLRSITYEAIPKELLPIGNVPTIRLPLEILKLAEIKNILVVIAPQTKHAIIDGLQSGQKFGLDIYYAVQEKGVDHNSGFGAAIHVAKNWIGEEEFVVACGDTIVCDFSGGKPLDCLKTLIAIHEKSGSIATVLVHPTAANPGRFGVVKFKKLYEENGAMFGDLENMVEKPDANVANSLKANGYHYIIAGYYVFKSKIFSYIEKAKPDAKNEIQITDAMKLAIENGEKVSGVVNATCKNGALFPCEYWDVGIPEDFKKANECLLEKCIDKWLSS